MAPAHRSPKLIDAARTFKRTPDDPRRLAPALTGDVARREAIGLGFLGASGLGAKTVNIPYWISLDLLGFSRLNQMISSVCAGFLPEFFFADLPSARKGRTGTSCRRHAKGRNRS
jgi:hypothetical protein